MQTAILPCTAEGSLNVVQCETRPPHDAKAALAYEANAGTIADALVQPAQGHGQRSDVCIDV
jgi:hypothetical protein